VCSSDLFWFKQSISNLSPKNNKEFLPFTASIACSVKNREIKPILLV